MFKTFFHFELANWLKSPTVYVLLAIVTMMSFQLTFSDNTSLTQQLDNLNFDAAYRVQSYYVEISILCALIVTVFVCSSAIRDFRYRTSPILFSKPVGKVPYLLGRFSASALVSIIPLLGISVGVLLACAMPGVAENRLAGHSWHAHVWSIVLFAIPNTFIVSTLIFAVSLRLRSMAGAFVAILILLAGYVIANVASNGLDNDFVVGLLDPFGLQALTKTCKYWTVEEKNFNFVGPTGTLLFNRLLWMTIGSLILAQTCHWFSFRTSSTATRKGANKQGAGKQSVQISTDDSLGSLAGTGNFGTIEDSRWNKFFANFWFDLWSVVKSPVFLFMIGIGMLNAAGSLALQTSGYGLSSLPVTYFLVDRIRGTFYLFLIITVAFYVGQLVWKDRDWSIHEIVDSMPVSRFAVVVSKVLSLITIIAMLNLVMICVAVAFQAYNGYWRFQIGLFCTELLVLDLFRITMLALLAFLSHSLARSKVVGHAIFVFLAVTNYFVWDALKVDTLLVQFGKLPSYTYSDMYGFGPFAGSLISYLVYWGLAGVLMLGAIMVFWRRGHDVRIAQRLKAGIQQLRGVTGIGFSIVGLLWLASAGWVYFNTQVLNPPLSEHAEKQIHVDYEKQFQSFSQSPQPRVQSIDYEVDIFPRERKVSLRGKVRFQNKTDSAIPRLFISIKRKFENLISVEGAKQVSNDEHPSVRIFEFDQPLQPGETSSFSFEVKREQSGFHNKAGDLRFVQNGTFFDNQLLPQIGYQPREEVEDEQDRKDLGLPPRSEKSAPDSVAQSALFNSYISNNSDWVDVETVISTSADQIAIAPGKLIDTWKVDDRRYFKYRVESKCKNFYSFVSGRYEVALRDWKGVDIEVYYHPEHHWNVSNMLLSVRDSLDYYTREFGPYKHSQARIIEFPRDRTFAQAFPGTMPYSEGAGFISRIKPNENIDQVFFVVAHEMAHQWWGHQVVGADALGATFLSETLAQYSALMVMEKRFGREMMHEFLRYELDNYLQSRGMSTEEERPLSHVGSDQGYIHYRKGAVVMYHLKEMIGEDQVNEALRNLIAKFGSRGAPYATSLDLIGMLREQTPAELKYLIDDLFMEITLFENRMELATCRELENGKFEVELEFHCNKFKADGRGVQKPVKLNDWIEIGVFSKPDSSSSYGKPLYRKRIHCTESTNHLTVVLDERPWNAAVDPDFLLIDRNLDDNRIRIERD